MPTFAVCCLTLSMRMRCCFGLKQCAHKLLTKVQPWLATQPPRLACPSALQSLTHSTYTSHSFTTIAKLNIPTIAKLNILTRMVSGTPMSFWLPSSRARTRSPCDLATTRAASGVAPAKKQGQFPKSPRHRPAANAQAMQSL